MLTAYERNSTAEIQKSPALPRQGSTTHSGISREQQTSCLSYHARMWWVLPVPHCIPQRLNISIKSYQSIHDINVIPSSKSSYKIAPVITFLKRELWPANYSWQYSTHWSTRGQRDTTNRNSSRLTVPICLGIPWEGGGVLNVFIFWFLWSINFNILRY